MPKAAAAGERLRGPRERVGALEAGPTLGCLTHRSAARVSRTASRDRRPCARQNRDAVSLTSAPDHAFANRCSTAAASADFPCAVNAAASPNNDHPFSGNRFRSSR